MLFDNSIDDGKEPVRIDEKASITYCNGRPLNTFLMELSCINAQGEPYDGWFMNKSSTTDMYALATNIRADFRSYGEITKDSFLSASIMLIWKKTIKEYLESRGLDEDSLRNCVKKLRDRSMPWKWQNPNTGAYEWDFEFDVNNSLATNPVCVKLSNSLLYRIEEKRLFVRSRKFLQNKDAPTMFQMQDVPDDMDSLTARLIDSVQFLMKKNDELERRLNSVESMHTMYNSKIGGGLFH